MKRWFWLLACGVLGLVSCRQDTLSRDPALRLSFSHDSVLFDTVFTTIGSSTRRVVVYNPHANALCIDRVCLHDGRYFRINLDGENDLDRLRDITLRGGDSLFLFVRVYINPQDSNTPVLVEDSVLFSVNGQVQHIGLQAYGQDVIILRSPTRLRVEKTLHLSAARPYLIYDTLVVTDDLTVDAGATLYMHAGAMLHAYGNVSAVGTLAQPIVLRGDRTDRLFDSVPYRVASGQWDGVYLLHSEGEPCPSYRMDYTEILSGMVGLYVWSEDSVNRPKLTFSNGRIHNQSWYGMVLFNTDAEVVNSEISNCASFGVYLSGGAHRFVHTTVASYFGYPYTNINIHSGTADTVPAVYVRNPEGFAPTTLSMCNCLVAGRNARNLQSSVPFDSTYGGRFVGNYLQADSLRGCFASDNVYAAHSNDTVFRNLYYRIGDYRYFDFRLDSLSPARHIGDSVVALSYPYDRLGKPRHARPDAGCYEFE